jgi:uridine phosphorylase
MFNFANLPITNEGRIYHLDLLPDELADTIITVGDPKRVDWVSRYFDSIEVKRSHREFTTHTGYIGKRRLSVLSTGIGTPNIDIVLNEVEALKNIDFVTRLPKQVRQQVDFIRLGTTGSLQSDISMDELVITTTAVGLDGLLHYYSYKSSTEEKELLKALNQHGFLLQPSIFSKQRW